MFCPVRAVFLGIFRRKSHKRFTKKEDPKSDFAVEPNPWSARRNLVKPNLCQTARSKILKSKQKPILIASSVSSGSDLKRPIASGLFKSIRISSNFSKPYFSGKAFPLKTFELLISLNFKDSKLRNSFWTKLLELKDPALNFSNRNFPRILFWPFRIDTFRGSCFGHFWNHDWTATNQRAKRDRRNRRDP